MAECSHDCGSCAASCGERTQDPGIQKAPMNGKSNIKRVVVVISGKGGVGKSSVTSMPERNEDDVRNALEAITKATENHDNGNLLECAVEAARVRCSLGEISDAVEKISGRYQAVIHTIFGVYSSEFTDKTELEKARTLADEFEKLSGRRPRIFVAKMGQDGHDRGQKVIASSFADMGWDVDVGPLFQTPAETAQDAVDNDVHMVGFSSLAAGHNTLLPELVDELKKRGRDDIMVSIGGVIPATAPRAGQPPTNSRIS